MRRREFITLLGGPLLDHPTHQRRLMIACVPADC